MSKVTRGLKVIGLSVVMSVVLIGCTIPNEYKKSIDKMNVFQNRYDDIIPQTIVYDIVTGHFNENLPEGKTKKKALILFMNGTRADTMPYLNDYNIGINRIKEEGGLYLTYNGGDGKGFRTDTAPTTASVLTGKWANEIGVIKDTDAKGIEPLTFVSQIGMTNKKSIFLSEWDSHTKLQYKAESEWVKKNGGMASFIDADGDNDLQSKLKNAISNNDLTVGLYSSVDNAGHSSGFSNNSGEYMSAVMNINGYVNELLDRILNSDTYAEEDWLIMVTSAHGGSNKSHYQGSIKDRTTWLVSNKSIA